MVPGDGPPHQLTLARFITTLEFEIQNSSKFQVGPELAKKPWILALYKVKLRIRSQGHWATCVWNHNKRQVENSKQWRLLVRENSMKSGSRLEAGSGDQANSCSAKEYCTACLRARILMNPS